MNNTRKTTSSIGVKLYLFIIIIVLAVAIGVAFLAYRINADQIDKYYKQVAYDSAMNFSSFVDADYLARLRKVAESEEYQKLRDEAEETDNEAIVQEYLEEKGLWEEYQLIRNDIDTYLSNMEAMKYLYIVAWGDTDDLYDMYLIDDSENPIYETGYYEEREQELLGIDASQIIEPTISNGDWGWLCSAFVPVYDSQGNLVCQVGCDIGMEDVLAERQQNLLYTILAAVILTILVLIGSVIYIRKIVIRPINSLTKEMEKFHPATNTSYQEAGVADLTIKSKDEINDLYQGIRSMQINIIDYLNDLDKLQRDKTRAEEDIRERDEQIGQLNKNLEHDPLTGVWSKAAYNKKTEEVSKEITEGKTDLAIVMVDMNHLKMINDLYGHRMGDMYIKGCCQMICSAYPNSPVYRIGGDEFVVLLEGEDFERRIELTEGLKAGFKESMSRKDVDPWQQYSAAVGMADLAFDDATIDLVFKRADKAMYKDKKAYQEQFGSYR